MRTMTIGIVAEGPTDVDLIRALVNKIIPGEHRFLILQPDISQTKGFGANGGGWEGVYNWCEDIVENYETINNFLNGADPNIDLLIIHIDADVAREKTINCVRPCPHAIDTVNALEEEIKSWLQIKQFPTNVICCIPADNTEAWVLCAFDYETEYHNPPQSYLECLKKPDYILSGQKYRVLAKSN